MNKSNGNELQSPQAENQDASEGAGSGGAGGTFENLSTVTKSTKSQKPKLIKPKKSDFEKTNSFGTDFLTLKAKKAFIHLRKVFTDALILRYFDPECHIRIETDVSGYAIGGLLSQMTLDQHSSDHVIHKANDQMNPPSKID